MAKEYITLKQAAAKWKSKQWYLAKACDAGQIPEAVKLNGEWIVLADLERPQMYIPSEPRMERPKLEHGSAYKDAIYRMTMSGFPDFNVRTHVINGKTYLVYSCFTANSSRTIGESLYGYAMHKAAEDCKREGVPYLDEASQREILSKIHEEDIQDLPSGDELRSYYLENFIAIGYSQAEIEELMAKIDEHIAKRNKKLGIE